MNAKYILERAASIQREGSEISVAVSLLLMHDAAELLMHAVIDFLALKKKFDFMSFWVVIKEAGYPEPPDYTPMETLNKLRVSLKHHAILPRTQTVEELIPRVRGFFENVLSTFCKLDYSAVSLVDLISDQEVCVTLRNAQSKFASGDKSGGLTDLRIALHKIQQPRGKRLPFLQAPAAPRMPPEMARAGWNSYLNQLHVFFDQMASRMNAAMLDINPLDYAALLQNTPTVQFSMSGKATVIMTSTYDHVSNDDFARLLNFLIEYSLKAEEAYIQVTTVPPATG